MLCYVISHVPGALKGLQNQTVLFWIHCCALILVRKSIVGMWQGGPTEPSTFPHAHACGRRGSGEGSEAAPGTATSIVPLLLRAANLPVPARPRWPLRLCSTNPECKKITAAITVLFIWEAKSKIASDLGVRRDTKRGALCLHPQRV